MDLLFQSPLTKTSGVFIEVHKNVYRGSTLEGSKVQKYIATLKAGVILYWDDHTIFKRFIVLDIKIKDYICSTPYRYIDVPGMSGIQIIIHIQEHLKINKAKTQKAGPLAIIQAAWLEPQYGLRWSRYTFD
jgi:hypothetical protein